MQAEEEKTNPFNNPTSSTQLIADNVSNTFRTSFVNDNYAGPSINILPARVSSSMINRPTECINKLNAIQDPVYNVAHASNADLQSSSYPKHKFNPLPPASDGAQTFKPFNCLSYSTNKRDTLYLMHARLLRFVKQPGLMNMFLHNLKLVPINHFTLGLKTTTLVPLTGNQPLK